MNGTGRNKVVKLKTAQQNPDFAELFILIFRF